VQEYRRADFRFSCSLLFAAFVLAPAVHIHNPQQRPLPSELRL